METYPSYQPDSPTKGDRCRPILRTMVDDLYLYTYRFKVHEDFDQYRINAWQKLPEAELSHNPHTRRLQEDRFRHVIGDIFPKNVPAIQAFHEYERDRDAVRFRYSRFKEKGMEKDLFPLRAIYARKIGEERFKALSLLEKSIFLQYAANPAIKEMLQVLFLDQVDQWVDQGRGITQENIGSVFRGLVLALGHQRANELGAVRTPQGIIAEYILMHPLQQRQITRLAA